MNKTLHVVRVVVEAKKKLKSETSFWSREK